MVKAVALALYFFGQGAQSGSAWTRGGVKFVRRWVALVRPSLMRRSEMNYNTSTTVLQ